MSRKRTERSRWVTLLTFRFGAGYNGEHVAERWAEVCAIVKAFEKVGRVVRVEASFEALCLRARK